MSTPDTKYYVHETAIVDDGCDVGESSKIWHFSHVLKGSRIGARCSLGQNVVVGPNVTIGSDCKIQNNVSVYEGVILEDGVFCGPSCVFTNVRNPRAFVSRREKFEPTIVRRGASIGANATIRLGVTLGEYSFVAAGATVVKDVQAHALVAGVPAQQIGWVSHAGEVLREDMTCRWSGDKYAVKDGALVRVLRGENTVRWPPDEGGLSS